MVGPLGLNVVTVNGPSVGVQLTAAAIVALPGVWFSHTVPVIVTACACNVHREPASTSTLANSIFRMSHSADLPYSR